MRVVGQDIKPEARAAYQLGLLSKSVWDNPFWVEYPKPSAKGDLDEDLGRFFVSGWLARS